MARLHSLQISGIRNFGPMDEDKQYVRFSSPLTLILGQNGCGKTTIIEALRFACTGDLPDGTNKGQGFVHDPKLISQFTSKGQVRLKLYDAKDNEYTIFKTIQVIQKTDKLVFSRPDTTLQHKDKHISGRCADIDLQCKEILGISAPILNNVIFCHQENSCWPLDEGQKLKKKFDEIFEITRYNKCTDDIRKLLKQKKDALKILRIEAEARKERKVEVERQKRKLQEEEERVVNLDESVLLKQQDLIPTEEKLKELLQTEANVSKLRGDLSVNESEIANLSQQQQLILKNIETEFHGDDEELQTEIDSFQDKTKSIEVTRKNLESRKVEIENQDKQLTLEQSELHIKCGQLNEEKKQLESYIRDRNTFLDEINKVDFHFDYENKENVTEGIEKIGEGIIKKSNYLKELSKQYDMQEKEKQVQVDDLTKSVTESKQMIEMKRKEIRQNGNKMQEINVKLSEMQLTDLNNVKNKINRLDEELKQLKLNFNEMAVAGSTEKEEKNIQSLLEQQDILEKEYKMLQKNDVLNAEIETIESAVQKCQSNIMKLNATYSNNFKQLFGNAVPDNNLKVVIESCILEEEKRTSHISQSMQINQRKLDSMKYELSAEEKKLNNLNEELKLMQDQFNKLCKMKSLDEVLKNTKGEIDQMQEKKGQLSSAKVIYEKFVKNFESEKPCCPVCQTNFSKKQDVAREIVKNIKLKIQGIPGELEVLNHSLMDLIEFQNKLIQFKPKYEEMKILEKNKIPHTIQQISVLQSDINQISSKLVELEKEIVTPKSKLEICRKVISVAAIIDENRGNIKRSHEKIKSLKPQLITVPSSRSKLEVESKIEDLKEKLRNAQQNMSFLRRKLDVFKTNCGEISENRNKLFERQLKLQMAIQSKPQLEEQLEELEKRNKCLENEICDLEMAVVPLEVELRDAKRRKEELKVQNKKNLEEEHCDYNKSVHILNEVRKLQSKIEVFAKKNLYAAWDSMYNRLEQCKKKLGILLKSKNKIINSLSEISLREVKQSEMFKNLESNVDLRRLRNKTNEISLRVSQLKEQITKCKIHDINNEIQKLRHKKEKTNNEINILLGKKSAHLAGIEELKKDLGRPEKRNVLSLYKEKVYAVKLQELLNYDLETYVRALEMSILEFHKTRMVVINKSLKELWSTIYRGNDIDYIQIRTEAGRQSASRRTYNYKVVQIKNGVELDLRGRCSAGQKVLACLIIRIALAETFAGNCGILTLDEPTTNLDKDNISSMSSALARLVNQRRVEKNFQLLVITHDEEFLEELKQVENLSHFWKLARKANGCSTISKIDI